MSTFTISGDDAPGRSLSAPEYRLDSARNDPLHTALARICGRRPLVMALTYFLISVGGTVVLGLLTGAISEVRYDYTNMINMGVILPIGALALFKLYAKIDSVFEVLRSTHALVAPDADIRKLMRQAQQLYASRLPVVLSLVASVGANVIVMFTKRGHWQGIDGGITAHYFRFFVVVNFLIIFLMLYKAVVTVWLMRRIFAMRLQVEPIHPDSCGGLKPLGDLSLNLNYFLGIIIAYGAVLSAFDDQAQASSLFLFMFGFVLVLSGVLLAFSLTKAHRIMFDARQRLLSGLHDVFQADYRSLLEGLAKHRFDVKVAAEIESQYSLFKLANGMPRWPFNFGFVVRFASTIVVPSILFLMQISIQISEFVSWLTGVAG